MTEEGTTSSPMETVLNLPELVEIIVYHLPEHIILTTAIRVSRMWLQIIERSNPIRQKLFLPTAKDCPMSPEDIERQSGLWVGN